MAHYVEEREFTLRIVFRCEFPDDYEGELDGYAWAEDVPAMTAQAVRASTTALRAHGDYRISASNRGRPAEDEVTLEVTRSLGDRRNEPSNS